ncbi:unnamed protein product [Owenia fusiformis]|uniref:Uncharacterized protein n=1 Tax=Owenia fusiformis TaxID=6347 RepID=A0A8J1TI77_OWEFU|nr:unnamed protein product [Owenia fusiformis]
MKSTSPRQGRSTATKTCPKCEKFIPVACKSCGCGHSFTLKTRTPEKDKGLGKPGGVVQTRQRALSERVRKETTRYCNVIDVQGIRNRSIKSRRARTQSLRTRMDSTSSTTSKSESPIEKPRDKPRIKVGRGRPSRAHLQRSKPTDTSQQMPTQVKDGSNEDSSSSREMEDVYSNIPKEKAMQYSIILAELNRKYLGQNFKPL